MFTHLGLVQQVQEYQVITHQVAAVAVATAQALIQLPVQHHQAAAEQVALVELQTQLAVLLEQLTQAVVAAAVESVELLTVQALQVVQAL